MKQATLVLVAMLLAAAGLWGCDTDQGAGPGPLPENSFLRQVDHGCLGTDGDDPLPVQYYCHVVDHGWQGDTLSITIAFNADCCVGFDEDVLIEGMSLHIAIRDTVPECDCHCSYRNDFLLLWHQPGEVILTFSNVNCAGATICELDTVLVVEAE